jgi:hypothetical protein
LVLILEERRKNILDEIEKKEQNGEIVLSDETIDYVLKFAQSLGYTPAMNYLNPMLVSSRMKDITLNPMQANEDTLTRAMQNPKGSEIALQAFGQDFEIQSQVYKELLSYLGQMLSFDLNYVAINAKRSDYGGATYSKDLDVLKSFLDRFDWKFEFAQVVSELLRSEAYFCCPRFDTGDQIVLQELPSSPQYTMITGRWNRGLLFSMNMYWFILPGISLEMYPSFFMEKYSNLWKNGNPLQGYNPALSPELRGNSSYVQWVDIPVDVGWCWKMTPQIASRVPYFSGLFLDLVLQPLYRNLAKSSAMASAAKIIIGEVPLLSKTTSQAQVRDQFSISASNLGAFLSLVKSAIGDALKTAAVPLTNVQGISFPSDNETYAKFLKNALATAGINSSLIFTSQDVRANAIESQLSLNKDQQMMSALYPQFEQFLNYSINKLTKKFKFKIKLEGTHFYTDRQQRFDKAIGLANLGVVLPNQIAASLGINPFDFQRQLEESEESDWISRLKPLVSAFQTPGNDKGGAPKKSDSEITDSGEQTKESAGNQGRGAKTT